MQWQYYHTVWLLMGLGWISIYLVRMGLAPLLDMIIEEFHISHAAAGTVFGAVLYSYGLMQLPSGFLGDRFGRRRILLCATMLWFLFAIGTALVRSLAMLLVLRFLTGAAHGAFFGNERPTIIAFTPREKIGQGQGVSFMGACLGLFLSVSLAGVLAEHFLGWRAVFLCFSLPSLIVCLLFFKYLKEPPTSSGVGQLPPIKTAYRDALSDRNLCLMYLIGFVLLYAYWVIVTWMPSVYREVGVSGLGKTSLLSAILGLTGIPALLASGMVSDRLVQRGYRREGFVALLLAIWAFMMFCIGYAVEQRGSSTLVTVLFLLSGLVVFGVWSPYYALLGDLAPRRTIGTTYGVANFIAFLGAWIAPTLTGWIKDSAGSFAAGLYLAGVLLTLGAFLAVTVRASPTPPTASRVKNEVPDQQALE